MQITMFIVICKFLMKRKNLKRYRFSALNLMLLPGLIYIIIDRYIPMVGIAIAFKRVDYSLGFIRSPWAGFDNFRFLFATRDAFIIVRNTLLYNFTFIILGIVLGLVSGVLLAEIASKIFQRIYQTVILIPQLFSMVIIAYIVLAFLSADAGFITKAILGPGREILFYTEPKYWPFILTFVNMWAGLGYTSIIYLSAIVSVDKNLYEAATIDGLGRFKQVLYVTIPCIKPTIMTLIMIKVGRIFYSDFGLFFQVPMNSGALFDVTNTLDTYVYRSLVTVNNISMASAAGAFQALMGFITLITVNYIIRKIDRESALF